MTAGLSAPFACFITPPLARAGRPLLQQIRECIHAAAPGAVEKISWQMPTFWQGENLIHFAAFKKHIGLFPGDMTESPFAERLASYHTSRGTIHIPLDRPPDLELIADIMRWRVKKVVAGLKPNEV